MGGAGRCILGLRDGHPCAHPGARTAAFTLPHPNLHVPSLPPQAVIRQNLVLAIGSILALALPTVLGWVPLWFAVMLHEGSTLLVALNSLRLLAYGAPPRRWQQPATAADGAAAAAPEAAAAGGPSGEQGMPAAVAA